MCTCLCLIESDEDLAVFDLYKRQFHMVQPSVRTQTQTHTEKSVRTYTKLLAVVLDGGKIFDLYFLCTFSYFLKSGRSLTLLWITCFLTAGADGLSYVVLKSTQCAGAPAPQTTVSGPNALKAISPRGRRSQSVYFNEASA